MIEQNDDEDGGKLSGEASGYGNTPSSIGSKGGAYRPADARTSACHDCHLFKQEAAWLKAVALLVPRAARSGVSGGGAAIAAAC